MQKLLNETKKFVSHVGIIGLILGSVFALCYIPFMKMEAAHQSMSQPTHVSQKTTQCCESQNSPHMASIIGTVINIVSFESLLVLLSLSLLFFLLKLSDLSKNIVALKFRLAKQFLLRLFDYLALAFSRGLLHPKLYNA